MTSVQWNCYAVGLKAVKRLHSLNYKSFSEALVHLITIGNLCLVMTFTVSQICMHNSMLLMEILNDR